MEIPAPSFEFRHRLPLQIRFNDIDLFGHLNNSVYVQFFDMGKLAYFKQFMGGRFEHEPTVPVVASLNCTFYAPAYIDDRLEVLTGILEISHSSLTLEQRIVDGNGIVKCIATTVMVNVDASTHKSTPVSNRWREVISEFEQRDL